MEVDINYWAVLVAAIASMVVGFLWYGMLFQKPWMAEMGITKESMQGKGGSATRGYIIQFIGSLIMACVLAEFLTYAMAFNNASGWMAGLAVGFWSWLGFIAPVTLGVVLWEGKSWKLWMINASHFLVSLLVMGIILSLWR